MSGFVEAAIIGAVIGGGTAAATGGDVKKGVTRGAVGGVVGGVVGPAAQISGVRAGAAAGGLAGGATARKGIAIPTPTAISPIPKTVMARERAERDDKLKKRKRATVMGGGLGELSLGTPGLLGV